MDLFRHQLVTNYARSDKRLKTLHHLTFPRSFGSAMPPIGLIAAVTLLAAAAACPDPKCKEHGGHLKTGDVENGGVNCKSLKRLVKVLIGDFFVFL